MGQKSGYRNRCERIDRKYDTVKRPGILGSVFRSHVLTHSEFKPSVPKSPKGRDANICVRCGIQKHRKRQGHCLREGNTLFDGALRILPRGVDLGPQETCLTKLFPSLLKMDIKRSSSSHQET